MGEETNDRDASIRVAEALYEIADNWAEQEKGQKWQGAVTKSPSDDPKRSL